MTFKFEKLEVWQHAMDYTDMMYAIVGKLPHSENDNLKSQIRRAATSITLNIAEGSTSQSDAEQARFVGMASDLSLKQSPVSIIFIDANICRTKLACVKHIRLVKNYLQNYKHCARHF